MPRRTFDIHIRLTKEEAADLKRKAQICGISQSALLRILLKGYEPREKPDDRFYEVMRQMCAIGNSLNQIAKVANSKGFINVKAYEENARKLNKFITEISKAVFVPERRDDKWLLQEFGL